MARRDSTAAAARLADEGPAPERPRLVETVAQQRREALALAIEEGALELFAERPFSAVKVEEIASRAGVAIRTFYRYFAAKEDVFSGLPRRGARQVAALMLARPPDEAPFDALIAAMRSSAREVDRAELDRWLAALLRSDATESIAHSAVMVMQGTLTKAIAERVGADVGDLWPMTAGAMVAAGLSIGTLQWMMHGGDLIDHEVAALEIAGQGLRTPP